MLLLELRADADRTGKGGFTPLFWAARSGDPAIVQRLLERGASAVKAGKKGDCPLSAVLAPGQATHHRPRITPFHPTPAWKSHVVKQLVLEEVVNNTRHVVGKISITTNIFEYLSRAYKMRLKCIKYENLQNYK